MNAKPPAGDPIVELVRQIGQIKNRFQLVGLLFAAVLIVITYKWAPGALLSQLAAGAIGILFLVFGQVFESLAKFPPRERARLTLALFITFAVLLLLLFALAIVAAYMERQATASRPPAPTPPGYISVSIAEPISLARMVKHLAAVKPDATVTFSSSCNDAVRNAQLPAGTYTADSLEQFLSDIRIRVEGTPPTYEVRQSGRIRYEIVCP